jgi:hypothetical protein
MLSRQEMASFGQALEMTAEMIDGRQRDNLDFYYPAEKIFIVRFGECNYATVRH